MHAPRLRSRKLALGSAAAIAITGAVTFTGIAVTQTASAGTNGQHIALCTDQSVTSADLTGINEYGLVAYASANTDNLTKGQWGCYELRDYWWKGNVTIRWTYLDGSTADSVCSVPESASSDVFNCSDY